MGSPLRSVDINRGILIAILALQAFQLYYSWPQKNWSDLTKLAPSTPLSKQNDGKIRGGAKYAMGSMNTKETSYDMIAISSKQRYADKHGYDMIWSFDEPAGQYSKDWDRLTEMQKVIEAKERGENDYEWIWWIDYDLIITNSSVTLESIVEDALSPVHPKRRAEIDMIITPDCFPVNSGSLLVRTTPWVLKVMEQWWKEKDIESAEGHGRSLQDCLRDMVADGALGMDKKSVFVKQWTMNAFPQEIHCHEDDRPWQKGDFVIHFAGAWAHVKEDDPTGYLMRKYAPMAI